MSGSNPVWGYFLERMDNRQWDDLEQSWCVDAALAYPRNEPNAILTINSGNGVPTLQQPTIVYGGANYSNFTFLYIEDPTGTGATMTWTILGGAVAEAAVVGTLTGYTNPQVIVQDPTMLGGGAVINIEVFYLATLTASAPVFSDAAGLGEVGDIVRMQDRLIEITEYVGPTTLVGQVLQQHGNVITDDPFNTPTPAAVGNWSIAAPVTTLYGLNHLEGMLVSILADGIVQQPQIVVNGTITLAQPATAIVAGLGFTCQLQTLYLDIPGGVTVQTRRKEIDQVVVRVSSSGTPFQVGINQPDASTQPDFANVPWTNLNEANNNPEQGGRTPLQPYDFVFGDIVVPVFDQLGLSNGQVAVQQTEPIPLTVLALAPWVRVQDDTDAA